MCGPSQKIGNVGQVANLPKTRQIDNLPHVGMLHIYCDGPYLACGRPYGGVGGGSVGRCSGEKSTSYMPGRWLEWSEAR